MTFIRITACPRCHRTPTIYRPYSRPGFAVTCEGCGGLLALGDDYDSAVVCWNNRIAEAHL